MVDQEITSSERQDGAYGAFNMHLIGLATQLAWLYLLLYSGGWNPSVSFTRAYGTADPLYLVSAAALGATMLAGALRTRQFMSFARNRVMQVVAPVAAATGTLLYCLISDTSIALAVCGGALTGFGSAILWARWASAFGRHAFKTILGMCPLIIGATALVCFSVGYLDSVLQMLVIIALPLASGAWLAVADTAHRARVQTSPANATSPLQQSSGHEIHHASKASKRHYGLLIAFASFLGFTTGVLPAFSQETVGLNYDVLFYTGIAVITLAFLAFAIYLDNRKNFALLYVFPVVVTICILLPFTSGSSGYATLLSTMAPLGCIAFELFLVVGSVIFARTVDYSPARVYIITRLFMTIFDSLGLTCGNYIVGQAEANVAMQIAAVGIFLIMEVFVALLAFAYFKARKGALEKKVVATQTRPTHDDSTCAVEDVPDSSDGAFDEPAVVSLVSSSGDMVATEKTLAGQCDALAQRYGLSAREADVLQLVAQGRSYARICEELTISQGTVNYHMSNLYAKLGVHSRQEVIDLVGDANSSLR